MTVCALLVAPTVASAAPTIAKLRVEAEGRALSPGTSYVNDTTKLATAPSQCGGTGQSRTVSGPSAIGIVNYARQTNRSVYPYFVSDKFDFGLVVCRIGESGAFSSSQAWLYRVNHKEAQVGGDQYRLARGDEVLWYFADFASGRNTGAELGLQAPVRARPGVAVTVKALAYAGEGNAQPAPGARVTTGEGAEVTGSDGTARVTFNESGWRRLRATRGSDIPAPFTAVCVNADVDRCPWRRPEQVVGTVTADSIPGGVAPDDVYAREGGDKIEVYGGGGDVVRCGPGSDTVRADRSDRVARDCEVVTGGPTRF